MSDATPMGDEELRLFAQHTMDLHTPEKQHHGYEGRCGECHFTRHPCDVFDLAAAVLRLLDRQQDGPACPICGVWHEGHYHHVNPLDLPTPEGDPPTGESVIETEMTDPKDRLAKMPWVKFDARRAWPT
jgi:hypothetical protein